MGAKTEASFLAHSGAFVPTRICVSTGYQRAPHRQLKTGRELSFDVDLKSGTVPLACSRMLAFDEKHWPIQKPTAQPVHRHVARQ